MTTIEARLKELDIQLPPVSTPRFSYVPITQTGNLLFLSGQDCRQDGKLIHSGKLGKDLTIEQGQEAARQTMINCIAVLKEYLGDLDRVTRIIKVLGFVNSADGFVDQPYVINGASDLLQQVFGDKGRHARSAVGMNELPFDTPVEIEMIVEIDD